MEYVFCPKRKGGQKIAAKICFVSCKEKECKIRDSLPQIRVAKYDKVVSFTTSVLKGGEKMDLSKMDLTKVKETILICGSDEEINASMLKQLQKPDDCFGKEYLESSDDCSRCVILAEIDGRRESLWVFCKELTALIKPPKEPELPKEKKFEPESEKEATKPKSKEEEKSKEEDSKMSKGKVTYVSVVKENIEKTNDEILDALRKAFPDADEKKLKGKLVATIKYLKK